MSEPAEVEAAGRRLREAGRALAARSDDEVLDLVGRVLDLWRDPTSRAREALAVRLPDATGFSPEVVREGLARGLAAWSGAELRGVFEREIAPHVRGGSRLAPFGLTSVLLAGSIPMPTLLSCLLPVALRSPVLVKTASRDRVTAELVAESVAEVDPELGRCIEVLSFAGDDDACLERLLTADCVVATGSDETIAAVARRTAAPQRVVLYGHRLSLAVASEAVTRGEPAQRFARALAMDVALWDQLGCLSPLSLHIVGDADASACQRMGEVLADALAECERSLPRGEVSVAAAAAIAQERAEARMREASGRDVRVHCGEGTSWTVVCEDEPGLRPAPLNRFLRVHPARDLGVLARALRPVARHLAGVALAGFAAGEARDVVARSLAGLGASRVCVPGSLQTPPLGWHHDGRGLLAPLARFCDVE